MKILAIDPGESTGIVVRNTEHPSRHREAVIHWWDNLDNIIEVVQPDVIVIEAFRLFGFAAKSLIGSDFPASQVIGVVKYLAQKAGITVVEQPSSVMKHIREVPKLKSPHMKAAWKHSEYYRIHHS